MQSVIYSHFNELRRKKSLSENRDISVRAVARETNMTLGTVQRVANSETVGSVRIQTLEALCRYFGVGVGELIEYREDEVK
ncbi:XRE family transcriptional regulator [bacterium]|nr:MAG: XRE family transcriptional regulator [bacterium]